MDKFRSLNPEQAGALFRTLLQFIGGIGVTYGYMTESQLTAIVSGLVTVLITAWGLWARTDKNLIKSAEQVPAVTAIVAPGTTMAASMDHPKIVEGNRS